MLISLCWATFTTITGLDNERIWSSFFLQYLWEFVLGMQLAKVYFEHPEKIKIPKLGVLLVTMIIGLGLTGMAGFAGGIWKSYNDIPSLLGYASIALIVYQLGIKWLNGFLEYTNKVSYEWYLIHILVFSVYHEVMNGMFPFYIAWLIQIIISYVIAISFKRMMLLTQ